MSIEWLNPWKPIEDADLARVYEEELAREVATGHPLAALPLVAVGQHGGTDDFVFRVNDGSGRFALVHLTWTGQRETPPWPNSMLFDSEAHWIEQGMKLDHEEYTRGG